MKRIEIISKYNQVYKACPKCETLCHIDVIEVVDFLDEINLDHPNFDIYGLTHNQKYLLSEFVSQKDFECKNCDYLFQVTVEVKKKPEIKVVI